MQWAVILITFELAHDIQIFVKTPTDKTSWKAKFLNIDYCRNNVTC